MSKNFDLIATVDIDISSPIVDDTSFGNLLIVGPLPKKTPTVAPADVGVYSSLKAVGDAGWVTTGKDADPVGLAAQVAFSQSPRPAAIYIAPVKADENATEAIKRALNVSGWYVVCPAGIDASEYESIAKLIEAQEKMFFYTELGFFDNEDTASVGGEYFRSMGIYGRGSTDQADEDIPSANQYLNVAWVAKWLNYESGSETAAFKVLDAVSPSVLSDTEVDKLTDANLNYFVTVGSKNITMNGMTMAGEWADVIRFRDWQKNDMQVAVVNLIVSRSKVPYTDSGIALVQNQMIASLKRGQNAGGIVDDEFDEDGNTIPGFVTSVPLSSSITASEKVSRKLCNCKFKARLAGAIHFAEITGSLTYEL